VGAGELIFWRKPKRQLIAVPARADSKTTLRGEPSPQGHGFLRFFFAKEKP